MIYKEYLKSEHWINRRNSYKKHHKICMACASLERLEVHHGRYDRLHIEKAKDLFVLCRDCHKYIHTRIKLLREKRGKRKVGDLMKVTKSYIKKTKKKIIKQNPKAFSKKYYLPLIKIKSMREYYINSKKVTKEQWTDFYKKNPKVKVILSTYKIPSIYIPPKIEKVISPEKAKEIRKKFNKLT